MLVIRKTQKLSLNTFPFSCFWYDRHFISSEEILMKTLRINTCIYDLSELKTLTFIIFFKSI